MNGEKTGDGPGAIPKNIIMDGPVVTKANAPGMLWMEDHLPAVIGDPTFLPRGEKVRHPGPFA